MMNVLVLGGRQACPFCEGTGIGVEDTPGAYRVLSSQEAFAMFARAVLAETAETVGLPGFEDAGRLAPTLLLRRARNEVLSAALDLALGGEDLSLPKSAVRAATAALLVWLACGEREGVTASFPGEVPL